MTQAVEPSATFDEVIDFPSGHTQRRKQRAEDEQVPVVVLTFRFDADEIVEIEQDLGPGALSSPELTVTRGYRTNVRTYSIATDEAGSRAADVR